MRRISSVLIAGAGPGGAGAAVALAERGVRVTLVEKSADAAVNGQAVTFGPNMLLTLVELDLIDDLVASGHNFRGIKTNMAISEPARTAHVESQVPGVKPMLTLWRRELHQTLTSRAVRAGAEYRVGVGFESAVQNGDTVSVTFTDGTAGEYDLVIGADGVRSRVRDFITPGIEPESIPQGAYRAVVDNPLGLDDPDLSFMGVRDDMLVGHIGLPHDRAYVTISYNRLEGWVDQADVPRRMRELLKDEVGELARLRDLVTDELADEAGRVSYKVMESVMVEGPWHKGRLVLVGDSAHGTTPNLGLGAGMALEDVLVLVRLLEEKSDRSLAEVLDDYSEQRLARTLVVNRNSARLARLQCELGSNNPKFFAEMQEAAAEFDATESPTNPQKYVDAFSGHQED